MAAETEKPDGIQFATELHGMAATPQRLPEKDVLIESIRDAREAGLKYVTPNELGIRRVRRGKGFSYTDESGRPIKDPATLERVSRLAIPPAWESVWICAHERGHLQAVGIDAKGRRQYLYHEAYRQARDCNKFNRLITFGACLPRMRRIVARDLRRPGLPKRKVLAVIVRLLDETCVRVGNAAYARENDSYGVTPLEVKHASVEGGTLTLKFRGKSGVEQEYSLDDARLARIVRRTRELPGRPLFQYLDGNGRCRTIQSSDVNDYIRLISGEDFTAKDFRTWHGTAQALAALLEAGPASSKAEARRRLSRAITRTASRLGNRPATCRSYYIHPAVIESYLDQGLFRATFRNVNAPLRSCEKTMLALVKRIHCPRVRLTVLARAS